MSLHFFSKFSPGGNTTVFLHQPAPGQPEQARLCTEAISGLGIGGEQAGFADLGKYHMEMGGGEFCANASRAFGALLDLSGAPANGKDCRCYSVTVSGQSGAVMLRVSGHAPDWRVAASFDTGEFALETAADGFDIAHLQGISHVLVNCLEFPDPGAACNQATTRLHVLGLEDRPASGLIWWRKLGSQIEILPFVQVSASNTRMLESSCGSGSLALALRLARSTGANQFQIRQPSGAVLDVELSPTHARASIGGRVSLIAQGSIWLGDPEPTVS